jgi:phosphopantetheinyl transferase
MTPATHAERPGIGVYYADTRNVGAADVEALVTDDDRDRLATMTRPSRRTQYLVGRALLRFALERWTGRPAALHCLTARVSGKPECVGGPMISVAHDGTLVVCAISSAGDVGVDVQFPAPRLRTADIARQYFSAAESHWLRGAPDDAFYMLWVLKEAYLKSLGHGLAGGLALLECRIAPPSIEATAAVRPDLALYSVGGAHLGVATVGCGFSEVGVESWSPSPACAVPPLRVVATTAYA